MLQQYKKDIVGDKLLAVANLPAHARWRKSCASLSPLQALLRVASSVTILHASPVVLRA